MTFELQENVPLAPFTTLRVGGPARWFAEARTETEIAAAAAFAEDRGVELFVLGGGSNLLVSDAGFAGLVLRVGLTGRAVRESETAGEALLDAAAGEDWDGLVGFAVERGLAGLECLAGIPGEVGGTPVQNVGAYGQEVADTVVEVRAFDREARGYVALSHAECAFSYRRSVFNSVLPDGTDARGRYVVSRVTYRLARNGSPALRYADVQRYFAERGQPGGIPTLREVYDAIRVIRARKGMLAGQPGANARSAGSFFKNPIVGAERAEAIASALRVPAAEVPHWPAGEGRIKLPAAWLIERAGFPRGYTLGRAGISTLHTLALVNRGGATAGEIVALRDAVRAGVESRFGVHLEQEPVLLGF
ncbi:MAG: UDP-N-acetylmuramate dehydrogenase [Acidobacteriota bacterium]|nr:UDP-N-acetylmuramate dehydrogenase [Acidobacteriota bacterium]